MLKNPLVHYAQRDDGARIAYWKEGDGVPLIHLPWIPYSHVQLECEIPAWRAWLDRLCEDWALIRFDPRGFGLSENHTDDFTLESLVQDLEAVVDDLDLGEFALFAPFTSGQVALAYAAKHPARVLTLFSWCSWPRATDTLQHKYAKALADMAGGDWDLHIRMFTQAALGSADPAVHEQWVRLMRESVKQETWRTAIRQLYEFDVTSLLPSIATAGLVLHRHVPWLPTSFARDLAAHLLNFELKLLKGASPAPCFGEREVVASALTDFHNAVQLEASPEGRLPNQLAIILFTDMRNSTGITNRLGDAKFQELREVHDKIVKGIAKSQGADPIKDTGDGITASFTSVARALDCAIEIQRRIATYNDKYIGEQLHLRVGLNAGEPIPSDGDIHGQSVNLAARIMSAADAGQILVSEGVMSAAEGKNFTFNDRGLYSLKGFEGQRRLFEVPWNNRPSGTTTGPPGSVAPHVGLPSRSRC